MSLSEKEILALKKKIAFNDQVQYAIKIIINSVYGAFGNKYFYFHNRNIAQSITRQGRNLILFAMSAINHYFIKMWHTDYELHKKLGIDHLKINPIVSNSALYADTDSTYCNFNLPIASVEGLSLSPQEKIMFCKKIVDERFEIYLNNAFEIYAQSYGVKNYMDFKLESISYNGIWVAKKNYTIKVGYEKFLLDNPELITKGLESIKPSHPKFARNILDSFIKLILAYNGNISLENDIIPKLKEHRKQIEIADIDDISLVKYVRTYDEYIKDDRYYPGNPDDYKKLNNLEDGTPINARASLYFNYFREVHSAFKYNKIIQGKQVRIYYAKHKDNPEWNIFAYPPKQYPIEFAFPVDYDEHFFKTVIEPLNRILSAIGYFRIDKKISLDVPVNVATTQADKKKEVKKVYVINSDSLEYTEIPSALIDLFLKKREPKDNEYAIYESYVYKYGINTEVVTDIKLNNYILTKNKDKVREAVREWLEGISKEKVEFFNEAIKKLSGLKYKKEIDFTQNVIIVRRSFSKVKMPILLPEFNSFRGIDDTIRKIKIYFKNNEPTTNLEVMQQKYNNYGNE